MGSGIGRTDERGRIKYSRAGCRSRCERLDYQLVCSRYVPQMCPLWNAQCQAANELQNLREVIEIVVR